MTTISKKNDKLILKEKYNEIDDNNTFYNKDMQKFLLKKELLEKNNRSEQFDFLYPHIDDPEFNIKISQKKEFNENKYDGSIHDLEEYSNKLCDADFELNPHQLFVRNFLSFNTPYNSLLLYHGLGTGKTCSAITVAEEMRDYLKQLKIFQRIIVVASPNVQDNFRSQLFDERKLELINNIWTMNSNCVGNKFLKELNPTNTSINKEKLSSQIKRLINESYLFMGYREFASYIHKISNIEDGQHNDNKKTSIQKKKLRKVFDNRLVIIDEVHNIRLLGTTDKHDKKIANSLTKLAKYTNNMRFLLLSGTPMYNHYSEIIWLINFMNLNDNRSTINKNDIFDKDGNFLKDEAGNEIGKDLFIHKITGYVSFIRGENPYIFPYRIFPSLFNLNNSLKSIQYPRTTLNKKPIVNPLQYIDVYTTKLQPYQKSVYNYIISNFNSNKKTNKKFEELDSFGYNELQHPIEALNIAYPYKNFNTTSKIPVNQLVGKNGLQRIVDVINDENDNKQYEYKDDVLKEFGRIFSLSEIEKYSSKIFSVCTNIINSEGVILVYSQYIEGGLIPMALALEELGFTRYGNTKSLFKNNNVKKNNMKYVMITGDIYYSKNNVEEITACTDKNNSDGENVKVILISRAGSEGIDLKYIRQSHILEPWYNTSRLEQILGRSIRSKSHCSLPFNKRNVQIFLHGTDLQSETEAADLYVYRVAETKAIQIGKVSRVLKETCVDCIVHHSQINFTEEKFNRKINILLSNKKSIEYNVGDKPYTNICDFMSECSYECKPNIKTENINIDTYDKTFIEFNNDKVIKRIKLLFKDHYFIKKPDIIKHVTSTHNYPIEHIHSALDFLINDKNEYLLDRFGIHGKLINIDEYYLFQPTNIQNNHISIYDRMTIPYHKNKSFIIEQNKNIPTKDKTAIKTTNLQSEFITYVKNKYNKILQKYDNTRGNKDTDIALSKVYHIYINAIDVNILNGLIIDHIIEHLPFENKLILLNYLYFNTITDNFEILVKDYFDKNILEYDGINGIYIYNETINTEFNDNSILLIKHTDSWQQAKMTDKQNFQKLVVSNLKNTYNNLNNVVGYISYFKKNNMYIFKTVDIGSKNKNKGKRCDQSGKADIIKVFNKAENASIYNSENTKNLTSLELCCLQELIFRYNTLNKKNSKTWFINVHDSHLFELSDWKLNI